MSIATVTRYALDREMKKAEIKKLKEGMPDGGRLRPREKSLMRDNAAMILSGNNIAEKYGYNSASVNNLNNTMDSPA